MGKRFDMEPVSLPEAWNFGHKRVMDR